MNYPQGFPALVLDDPEDPDSTVGTALVDGDVHLYPTFGPAHNLCPGCWCMPLFVVGPGPERVIFHNPAQWSS